MATQLAKPQPLAVMIDGIPADLACRTQFVGWAYEWRSDKWTKVPKNPHTGGNADTAKPDTWDTLAQAHAAATVHGWDGIGFVFSAADPFFGIDCDGCRDPESG